MPMHWMDYEGHDCEISKPCERNCRKSRGDQGDEAVSWVRCHLVWRVVDEGPPSHLRLRNLMSRKDEQIVEVLRHS
ncbi:UNVERIFIED_CONTAM: hypothetical protein Slati_2770600 [Sesamum latifolium]|uniref:Uncharacterized protein n=1 Tax=Sesamum latifolium TaxID=2727402 RepID=A0AAW2VZ70_9LAMI